MNLMSRLKELENKNDNDLTENEKQEIKDLSLEYENGLLNINKMSELNKQYFLKQWGQ